MLRSIVLALMADGRPAHGYALMKAFATRSGVQLGIGHVYRELQRLRAEGLIAPVPNPADADPRRCPYTITDAGRAAVRRWLGTSLDAFVRRLPDPLHHRLAMLLDGEPDRTDALLADLETELGVQARSVARGRAVDETEEGTPAAFPMRSMLLGRQARHLAADIEWVRELRSRLAGWRAHPREPRSPAAARGGGRRQRGPERVARS